jgi:hypothetical protein
VGKLRHLKTEAREAIDTQILMHFFRTVLHLTVHHVCLF